MGHDSSDFMTCDKCQCYEIDQRGECAGVDSGIMCCTKHTFCIQCFPKAFKDIKDSFSDLDRIRQLPESCFEWYDFTAESTDEEILADLEDDLMLQRYLHKGLPKELCPMCEAEGKKKKRVNRDKEVMKYLLDKVGMTKRQVVKEMNKGETQ